MKLNRNILSEAIAKTLKEYLDYNAADLGLDDYNEIDPLDASDALYDEYMDQMENEDPEGFKTNPMCTSTPQVANHEDFSDLPFESKKGKKTLTENSLRAIIKESISEMMRENYPTMSSSELARAPWNQTDDSEEKEVSGQAYYINNETDDDLTIPFDITVTVSGTYEDDYNEDGHNPYFVADEGTDYEELVRQSGEVPETLENGFVLDSIEIEYVG